MFAFEGQIFQFVANLWKEQNDTFENLVLVPKCNGSKLFWAEVIPGLSRHRAKVLLGMKYFELKGAKETPSTYTF